MFFSFAGVESCWSCFQADLQEDLNWFLPNMMAPPAEKGSQRLHRHKPMPLVYHPSSPHHSSIPRSVHLSIFYGFFSPHIFYSGKNVALSCQSQFNHGVGQCTNHVTLQKCLHICQWLILYICLRVGAPLINMLHCVGHMNADSCSSVGFSQFVHYDQWECNDCCKEKKWVKEKVWGFVKSSLCSLNNCSG